MADEIQLRGTAEHDDLISRAGEYLLKIFGIQREIFENNRQYIKVTSAMLAQISWHVQAAVEAAETIEAAYMHQKEDAEVQASLMARQADVLTPIINYKVYLERDPNTTAALLTLVSKKAFIAGLELLDDERRAEIKLWVMEGK